MQAGAQRGDADDAPLDGGLPVVLQHWALKDAFLLLRTTRLNNCNFHSDFHRGDISMNFERGQEGTRMMSGSIFELRPIHSSPIAACSPPPAAPIRRGALCVVRVPNERRQRAMRGGGGVAHSTEERSTARWLSLRKGGMRTIRTHTHSRSLLVRSRASSAALLSMPNAAAAPLTATAAAPQQSQHPPQSDPLDPSVRIHFERSDSAAAADSDRHDQATADTDSHSHASSASHSLESQPGLPTPPLSTAAAVAAAAMTDAELAAALASARSSVEHLAALLAARNLPDTAADSSPDDHRHHSLVRTHSSHAGCTVLHEDRGVDQTFQTVVPLRELLGPGESPDACVPAQQMDKMEAHKAALTSLQIDSMQLPSQPAPRSSRQRYSFARYLRKFSGQHVSTPPMGDVWHIVLSFVASFVGIAVPALMNYNLLDAVDHRELFFLLPSFGATAVLLYAVPQSDLGQPRNALMGNIGSAIIGITVRLLVPMPHAWGDPTPLPSDPVYARFLATQWLACALAVSLAILFMSLARCLHPPGGATALIPNMIAPAIQSLGWQYVGFVAVTTSVMVLVALIFNNIPRKAVWPKYWI